MHQIGFPNVFVQLKWIEIYRKLLHKMLIGIIWKNVHNQIHLSNIRWNNVYTLLTNLQISIVIFQSRSLISKVFKLNLSWSLFIFLRSFLNFECVAKREPGSTDNRNELLESTDQRSGGCGIGRQPSQKRGNRRRSGEVLKINFACFSNSAQLSLLNP